MTHPASCPCCGRPLPRGRSENLRPACLLQARFPELGILRLIGRGGMGAVDQVRQPALALCW